MHHPSITGPASLAASAGFAITPWMNNVELGLRVLSILLSCLASWYAIKYYKGK
jgi:hypothetical protein